MAGARRQEATGIAGFARIWPPPVLTAAVSPVFSGGVKGLAHMSDIFHEVDEDVRRDKAAELWRRYHTPILIFAVLIVAATGA